MRAAFAGVGTSVMQLAPHFAGVVTAVQGLNAAMEPLVQALGVTLVVAASVGANMLAAAIQQLPGIVGPMIDQVTASINMIATTVSGVTGAIVALATGDWAAA